MSQKVLVKHVRDAFGNPFATIVAVDADKLGLAVCCPRDHFSKKTGIHVATQRALKGHMPKLPSREVLQCLDDKDYVLKLEAIVGAELTLMKCRAKKYFKPLEPVVTQKCAGYYNIYQCGDGSFNGSVRHDTRKQADVGANDRVACVKVMYTEGQFDK